MITGVPKAAILLKQKGQRTWRRKSCHACSKRSISLVSQSNLRISRWDDLCVKKQHWTRVRFNKWTTNEEIRVCRRPKSCTACDNKMIRETDWMWGRTTQFHPVGDSRLPPSFPSFWRWLFVTMIAPDFPVRYWNILYAVCDMCDRLLRLMSISCGWNWSTTHCWCSWQLSCWTIVL